MSVMVRRNRYDVTLGMTGAAAGGGCAESAAFIARTTGLNAGHQSAYETLICGLVTDGVWAKLDVFYVFATADRTTACLNLISSSFNATEVSTVNFTADRGYTGNGTSFFLNSHFTPNTDGVTFLQNSASMGVYQLNNLVDNNYTIGSFNTVNEQIVVHANATLAIAAINANTGFNPTTSKSNGFWVASRTASNLTTWYENGAGPQTDTVAPGGRDGVPTAIFARLLTAAPTADSFSSAELSAAFMGGGLTGTDVANLSSRLNAYMTTYSINQY